MRQVIILALMIPLVFLLSACGNLGNKEEKIACEFSDAQKIVLNTRVSAHYGDKVFEFKLKYTEDENERAVEITEPEELSGIRAVYKEDGFELCFDGASITTGELTGVGLSPCEVVGCLVDQWKNGYVISLASEVYDGVETVSAETHITDTVSQKTWFDSETLLPVRSEMYREGTAVIFCEFENVIVE